MSYHGQLRHDLHRRQRPPALPGVAKSARRQAHRIGGMSSPAPVRSREQIDADVQRNFERIQTLMLDHARRHPLARPLSAKQIQARFPHLGLSTIHWYCKWIREEAERALEIL